MLLELTPFLIGRITVFLRRPDCSSAVEEAPVGADDIVLEDGEIGLCGGQCFMTEKACGDVNGGDRR
ncbi:hypothetical protein [Amycolatopsis sp. lyj-84]|uniref:hypothetical protein n=1 Tax=Amycolatopsis sp. lyj-84 TaxID=2789284 RepID=UPI00397A9EE1